MHARARARVCRYVNGYEKSISVLDKLNGNKKFQKLLEENREKYGHGKTLAFYLIMPVQRIPRYVLLFKTLKKYTRRSHEDYASINAEVEKKYDEIKTSVNGVKGFICGVDKPAAQKESTGQSKTKGKRKKQNI